MHGPDTPDSKLGRAVPGRDGQRPTPALTQAAARWGWVRVLAGGALVAGGAAALLGRADAAPPVRAVDASPRAAQAAQATTPRPAVPPEVRSLSNAFATVAEALKPSVVRIDVETGASKRGRRGGADGVPPDLRRFFDGGLDMMPMPLRGTGSGVIIDGAGNIVTNRHVVDKATRLKVTLHDGRELTAHTVGADEQTDVAVIRLDHPPQDLVAARMGYPEAVRVGEWVIAVGCPLGFDQTVTAGIVSARGRVGGRVTMSGQKVRGYIQTDARINPGNSGGPLVNLDGEVIGINTLIQGGPGGSYGFAIPINEVRRVSDALIRDGRVRYAFLGVAMKDLKSIELENPDLAKDLSGRGLRKGAFVATVTPGSPAQKAGLRPGDVITRIDDKNVAEAGDVIDHVAGKTIGSKVTLAFQRDGKQANASATLSELPGSGATLASASGPDDDDGDADDQAPGSDGPSQGRKIGVALQDLTPELAESLGLGKKARGAVIAEVVPGSAAAKAGLAPGDVILDVDRKPVASATEAVAALRKPGDTLLLRVRSAKGIRFVTVKP